MSTHRTTRGAALAALLTAAVVAPGLAPGQGRAVALTDASGPPTWLRLLAPGKATHRPRQCPGGAFYSDVHAYRWDGRALGPQRWNTDHDRQTWRGVRGRVTFDGVSFHNGTRRPVLAAGWCE